ncbi:hypothetical protein B0T14DRAFT_596023 [Immersiella caudata]|uniref:WSC domain-containing protein n=1 Tax=Immersiella caudata TaxID=314043 RepID=A0AA39U1W4_9PEZI|nr:hypothetical protein B0T14DRAFT_596023 [Immersiella caudata]
MDMRFLLGLALAALVQSYVSQPLYLSNRARLHNLKRGISSDPSCPDNFLCVEEACVGSVVCPAGYRCINFEGNNACAPIRSQFCALNPTTLVGVGCWGGICCHGQCYVQEAVCCDRPSVTCTLGTACNVCPPDQVCDGSASNGCRAEGASSSISSTSPVPTPPPSSSIAGPSATSSQPPTSSGTPSCRIDSAASLIVRSGSSPLSGSALSQDCLLSLNDGWRYFGVEHGVECFWGNSLANATVLDPDCSTSCPDGQIGPNTCGAGSSGVTLFENDAWEPISQ